MKMVRRRRNDENLPKVIKTINELTGENIATQTSDEESNTEVIDLRPSGMLRQMRNRQLRSRSHIDRFIRNRQRLRGNRSMSRARSRSRRRSSRRRHRRISRDRQLERRIFRRNIIQNRNNMNSGDWFIPVSEMSDEGVEESVNVYLISVPAVDGTEFLQNTVEYNDENNNSIQSENSENNPLNFDIKRVIYSIVNSNNLSQNVQKNNDGVDEETSEDQPKIVELPRMEENKNIDNEAINDNNDSDETQNKKRKVE